MKLHPRTLSILTIILESQKFSQRGIWEYMNANGMPVSIGMINLVVNDMKRVGFIERGVDRSAGYSLADPVGLLRFIAMFRPMPRLFTYRIAPSDAEVVRELAKGGHIACIGTAMRLYAPYFNPEEVSFYAKKPDMEKLLMTARRGETKVSGYAIDYPLRIEKKGGIATTSRVQTAIDMFCDGKGAYARPLLESVWGIKT